MMNQKDAAAYALEQLQKAGADDAAVLVTTGKIDEMNIDGGEFSLMRSGFKSGLSLKAIKEQKTGNIHINSCEKETIDAAVADCMAAVLAAQMLAIEDSELAARLDAAPEPTEKEATNA